jgi:hyaluronate lyase
MAKHGCALGNYAALKSILEDDTIPTDEPYELAHAWFTADRVAAHRDDFAFCVSMPSFRHQNYECINNANKTGWYTNDGALYVYTKTDPHEFDGPNFVLNSRLAHRVPGTTTDTKERAAVSIGGGKSWKPPQDRVGCMQIDSKYAMAAMDYECYHRDEDQEAEDKGYGGGQPKFISDLVAKKAYFMFDEECVCLGAGINSTKDECVNTTVENRRLVKREKLDTGTDQITVNGEKLPDEPFDMSFDGARYARVEGFSGFVFLDAERISVSKYMYEIPEDVYGMHVKLPEYALGERPFVEIMINHGQHPAEATYAYAVLPYASDERLKAYSQSPEVEILSNTPVCQAVRKKSVGITGIMFYEAAECCGIRADKPCLVMVSERGGEYKISVSEPTNKQDEVKLTISQRLECTQCDRRYTVKCADVTELTLDTSLSVGGAYAASFKVLE